MVVAKSKIDIIQKFRNGDNVSHRKRLLKLINFIIIKSSTHESHTVALTAVNASYYHKKSPVQEEVPHHQSFSGILQNYGTVSDQFLSHDEDVASKSINYAVWMTSMRSHLIFGFGSKAYNGTLACKIDKFQ